MSIQAPHRLSTKAKRCKGGCVRIGSGCARLHRRSYPVPSSLHVPPSLLEPPLFPPSSHRPREDSNPHPSRPISGLYLPSHDSAAFSPRLLHRPETLLLQPTYLQHLNNPSFPPSIVSEQPRHCTYTSSTPNHSTHTYRKPTNLPRHDIHSPYEPNMADFSAPPGPPPPKVPEGWVARWNDQYKEW